MRKTKRTIIVLVAFAVTIVSLAQVARSQTKTGQTPDLLPSSTTRQIIKHDHYTLSYAEQYEQAEWVAYWLQPHLGSTHFNGHFSSPIPK